LEAKEKRTSDGLLSSENLKEEKEEETPPSASLSRPVVRGVIQNDTGE
jgi:hypothetical protein